MAAAVEAATPARKPVTTPATGPARKPIGAPGGSPPVPTLTRWGLSPAADLVYRTLLAFGPQTCDRAAQELGLAARRVGEALEELASAGAARPKAPSGFDVARPDEWEWNAQPVQRVLDTIVRRRRGGISPAEGWRRHVAALAPVEWSALESGTVRRLPNRLIARRRIADLIAAERYEHLAINPEEVFSTDAAAAALPLERQMLARGIKMRTLGLPPSDGDLSCAYATELDKLDHEYRECDALPLKLMVFDRRAALFPADPINFEAGAIEVTDPVAVQHLVSLFNRCWTEGRDPRRKGVPPIVLSQREKALVALLADGHSEESAAAQLGVSRRTVLYALRSLMDRIGVENRFQLALVLGATGTAPIPTYSGAREQPAAVLEK